MNFQDLNLKICVEQGDRDKIVKHAKKREESTKAFINRAIKETMKKDK